MVRWMCDSLKKQRWKGESVASDCLKRFIRWWKGDGDIVGTIDRCAKLI